MIAAPQWFYIYIYSNTHLVWVRRGGAWTGGQAIGGIGWRSRGGGVETDEGCGQEISLWRGGGLALVVLESALCFAELCLQQVDFLNTASQNMFIVCKLTLYINTK